MHPEFSKSLIFQFLLLLSSKLSLLSSITHLSLLRSRFRNRRSVPGGISFSLNRSFPCSETGSIVAFGGEDDTIHLYDLSVASSLGSLHQHSTFVTVLSFYALPNLHFPRNLISADDAGSLTIFDANGFVHLTTLSVHCNAGINDLALHLSGERDR
ncbi:hypothetical protein VIGAN_09085300 [Vigna angularis var. angularis]|uniref:Uncharacterized protein n=1 Tax=Vigna angularis var. angularis TaxID=157739 RepID=A0A0S3SX94_PHAAN|nr:hypothetical protein VIGAN_09085300 [Vigna angularis var. angularis]